MASTNKTPKLELSQFINTDTPSWRQDYNGDMNKIDVAYAADISNADTAAEITDGDYIKVYDTSESKNTKTLISSLISKIKASVGVSELKDVNVTTPIDKQGLVYDAATGKWVNGDILDNTELMRYIDNAILGNIFPNRAVSQTVSGVTFTVNADKTITANGTYESQTPYLLSDGWASTNVEWIKPFEGKTVCISGSIVGVLFTVKFYDKNNVITTIETGYDGDEKVGIIPTNIVKYEAYLFNSGLYTLTDAVFKPMLRLTTELMRYTDNAVLGAKNLLPNNATNQTIGGVTFTKNADGTITLNGTATETIDFNLNVPSIYCSSDYKVGIVGAGCTLRVHTTDDVWYGHEGVEDTIPQGKTIDAALVLVGAITYNNATLYPMIRLATDTDDTFAPYAMTNRELTKNKINIADLKTVVSASSDFADFKTRIASL